MEITESDLHSLPAAPLFLIIFLAMAIGVYGLMNLRSAAFKIHNSRSDIEQADKLVTGVFNIIISVVAICSMILIST